MRSFCGERLGVMLVCCSGEKWEGCLEKCDEAEEKSFGKEQLLFRKTKIRRIIFLSKVRKFCSLKPIFHWKWGSRWLPNANEIYTKKMKCTWPTQEICVWDPTPPIFH